MLDVYGPLARASKALAVVAFAALCAGGSANAQTQVKWISVGHLPPSNPSNKVQEHLIELIEKYSDGSIKIAHHPAEQLVAARDMLEATRGGVADMSYLVTSYWPSELPFSSTAATLPNLWTWKTLDVAQNALQPHLERELGARGIKPLLAVPTPTQWFFKKETNVDVPDWSGRRIRTYSPTISRTIEIFKGTPVQMAGSDVPSAISQGLLDGVATATSVYLGYDTVKEMPCAVMVNAVPLIGILALNENSWKKLSPAQQKAVERAVRETAQWMPGYLEAEEVKDIAQVKSKTKCVAELTDTQQAKWQNLLAPIYTEFVAKFGESARVFLAKFNR